MDGRFLFLHKFNFLLLNYVFSTDLYTTDLYTTILHIVGDCTGSVVLLQVLERHTRGILSMAWSRADPDLLISCGKDNKLLCWNPNADVVGGQVRC